MKPDPMMNEDEGAMEKPSDMTESGGMGEFYVARKDIVGMPELQKGETANIKVTGKVTEVTPDGFSISIQKMEPCVQAEKDGKLNSFANSLTRRRSGMSQQGGV